MKFDYKNKNVGNTDRMIRIGAGVVLIGWALLGGPALAWIGIVPLATGLMNYCPVYTLLGKNTCNMK